MPNLSTLFPSVTVRDVYTPGSFKFTGAERWYDTAYTGAGDSITMVARFKRATFAGDTTETIMRGYSGSYSQAALFLHSTGFTTPTTRQGTFRFYVQNAAGTTLCSLFTDADIWMDDEWHTILASYDGGTAKAVMYIDGVAAIDATNAEHVAPIVGTPNGGSNDFAVGSALISDLYQYAGHVGYIGFCQTYVNDWTLFMEPDGSPKKIDEVNWTEFNGVQPLYWNENGEVVRSNKGSGGNLVRNANCVFSDAPVTRSGIITYPFTDALAKESVANKLDAFWTMDETGVAAARVDAHGNIDMLDLLGLNVTSATGVNIGVATSFDCASSDAGSPSALYHSAYPDHHAGEGSFGAFVWVEPAILDTGSWLVGRTDNASAAFDSWGMYLEGTTDLPGMRVTASNVDYTVLFGSAVNTSNTYFIACYYDYFNDEMGISVNGSAYTTGTVTGKRDNDGDRVFVGRRGFTSNKMYYMGLMNRSGLTRTPLTMAEIGWMYNSGLGRSYLDITS